MKDATRTGGFFAAYFFGIGLFLPFFPLLLSANGHGPAEIGTLLAVPIAVRLVANPLMTNLADRLQATKGSIVIFAVVSAILFLVLVKPLGFWATFFLLALIAAFWSPILPLSDAMAVNLVRKRRGDYGRMRLWGSIAFVVANLAGGVLLQYFSASWLIGGIVGGLVVVFALAVTMPACEGEETGGDNSGGSDTSVLKSPVFLLFLAAAGLVQASHAAYYGFGSLYWTQNGIAETAVGALWMLGVVTEILLFYFASRLQSRISPVGFLLIGSAAAVLRWLLFPFVTDFALIVVLQGLHGLTFGATHLGAVGLIAKAVSSRRSGTGQGLLSTAVGGMSALATAAAGPLFGSDPAAAFQLMAAMSVAAFLLIAALNRPLGRLQSAN
ncbi:MFS transporter [Stappia sp. GBMRC 2046]|uniref:MFS transporter n=1 Tax=Stappia sediminis TaxID=2692190 RepID=A0A7X3LRD6_9HYPH|nr:MFS transporter [Stappia sediminis]MXN63680.1 MFS transporter [Stappia sediminis]